MKSRGFKLVLCLSILFSLIAASFALVKPLYLSLYKGLRSNIINLNSTLDKSLGINIFYSSLSPSILTGINIKGIVLKDSESGQKIVSVKKATVKYSLLEILKGNFANSISEVIVNNGYIEITQNKDFPLEELLAKLNFNGDSPFKVKINNVKIYYADSANQLELSGDFRRISIERAFSYGKYAIEIVGRISGEYRKNTFSTNVFFECSFLNKVDNSSAVVQFFNTSFNSYSLSQIGFLGEYSDSVFKLKMLPSFQNLYIELSFDFKTKDIKTRFDCNSFRLSSILSGIKRKTAEQMIANLIVSANLNASYNLETKKVKYSSSGDVFFPERFVAGGFSVSYALNGNERYVSIPYFRGTGNAFDAEYSGGINLKTVQPEGVLSVNRLLLPDGELCSAEIFLEPLAKGFMVFSPEILLGQKVFTAAQLSIIPQFDGYDFDFDIYDYSHAETGEPGILKLTGNYLTASKFFQSNISVEGMYIDSLMETVSFFLDKNISSLIKDASPVFKNTIFATDIYFSSYNGNYSYSIPTAIIADTLSDSKMLILALDGNNENLQLRRFELIFNDQKILATAHSENILEPNSKLMNTILSGQVEYNSIPYAFSGLINKDWISITGDYGLNFSMMTDSESDNILGNFALNEFPVKFDSSAISIFADSSFYYNAVDKFNLNISKFVVKGFDGLYDNNPAFLLKGNVNKNGASFDEINFTDSSSNLSGNGSVVWNFENDSFMSADYDINLIDSLYNEKVSLSGKISNPEHKPLTTESFLNDYFVSTLISFSNFRTGRFVGNAVSQNTMNVEISVTGVLSNPMVSISVPSGTLLLNNVPFIFSMQASIVDREFELAGASVKWGTTEITDIQSKFSFKDWLGFVSFNVEAHVMGKTVSAPVNVSLKGIKDELEKKGILETMEIDISTPRISGTLIKVPQALSVHILKMADEIFISSTENLGLTGSILANGDLSISIDNKIPFKMKVSGNTKLKNRDLNFFDIEVDLAETLKLIDYSFIKVYNGKLIGDFKITGEKNDRGFDGALQIIPAEFSMPEYFKNHAKTDIIYIFLAKDQIFTPKTRCLLKRSPVDVTVNVQFNKMAFESVSVLVKTVDETYAPVNINMNQVHVKGNVQTDLDITVENEAITVLGSIVAKDTTAEFGTTTINDVVSNFNQVQSDDSVNVQVILDVTMKNRVQVYYSSFLRGLVVPSSQVVFKYNSIDDKMTLDGDVPLRSGEFIYLNSSFYIKEGNISFSEDDSGIDPYVSLRAETRELDEDNNEVTISLAVDHQKVSNLSPKLTSSPAKSEKQIMELLGNFVSANSENMTSFMLATGDYALQTMVMRKIENGLRDFLNFDILSIRTMVVQNALKYSISRESERQGINISNFFDNTTVYIGKYFSKALYADAMLRLSYNKNRINDATTLQGLIFKPEIGFELESPLAKIRWSVAPDLSDLSQSRIMIIPSLTLSWKFNF